MTSSIKTDLDEVREIRRKRYLKRNKERQEKLSHPEKKQALHRQQNMPSYPCNIIIKRDAMKAHTISLIIKGYTLEEGLAVLNMGKRTYYRWAVEKPEELSSRIEKLKRRASNGYLTINNPIRFQYQEKLLHINLGDI